MGPHEPEAELSVGPHEASSPRSSKGVQCSSASDRLLVMVDTSDSGATQSAVTAPPVLTQSKIRFLDGLRGLAALLVLAQHSGFNGGANLGAVGVDIFFVLSAFLLTRIMDRKCRQLIEQRATIKQWTLASADYFSKRFLRVYPLFALVALLLFVLPASAKKRYFLVTEPDQYSLVGVLTFETKFRYHVFWTLPLEITYYFFIPLFAVAMHKIGRFWWLPLPLLYVWIVYAGLFGFRNDHMPLKPHMPTFIAGSLAAIISLKAEAAVKQQSIRLSQRLKTWLHALEFVALVLILVAVAFKGSLVYQIFKQPRSKGHQGMPFISVNVTYLIVVELLAPSLISRLLESRMLYYWGKISFSAYLLHSFVIYTHGIRTLPEIVRYPLEFVLTMLLATISYQLIEYPLQVLTGCISKALAQCSAQRTTSATLPLVVELKPMTQYGSISK